LINVAASLLEWEVDSQVFLWNGCSTGVLLHPDTLVLIGKSINNSECKTKLSVPLLELA